MTDDEIIVDEQPVADEPEFKWDLGVDDEPNEDDKPLTMAELRAILAESQTKKDEEVKTYSDEIIQKAVAEATKQTDQKLAMAMAPMARQGLASKIAAGLPDSARAYLEEKFSDYDANGLAAIAKDKNTVQLLRDAAENAARKGGNKSVPRSEDTTTINTPNLSMEQERQIEQAWAEWKDVPGMTKEKIREYYKESA